TFETVRGGGKKGENVIPGVLNPGDLYKRISLPKSHDDFTPSEGKPPLSEEEVALIGWWISAQAPAEGYFTALNPDQEMKDLVEKYLGLDQNKLLNQQVEAPNTNVVDSLTNFGFILNPLMIDNHFLEANFSLSEQEFTKEASEALLLLKDQIIWLNLSNSGIEDGHLQKIGQLENLIKLNLSKTDISDEGLTHLSNLTNLESLNLYKTKISVGLLEVIPKLTNLKRLYISETMADSTVVNQLQQHKDLRVEFD
ncbi:MAG: hypothetical protein AB3N10_21580, partial [Allomuricauda sp.]